MKCYNDYMSRKTFYYIAAFVGSIVGGWIPTLWGADWFSISSLVFSTLFALLGIYLVYKFL